MDDLLPLMQCPICHTSLSPGKTVTCGEGHEWPVEDGVLAFTREDAPSDPWSRSYADYEKFVRGNQQGIGSQTQNQRAFFPHGNKLVRLPLIENDESIRAFYAL